jgi:hypothetical protein
MIPFFLEALYIRNAVGNQKVINHSQCIMSNVDTVTRDLFYQQVDLQLCKLDSSSGHPVSVLVASILTQQSVDPIIALHI